jgi:hypothetical protein
MEHVQDIEFSLDILVVMEFTILHKPLAIGVTLVVLSVLVGMELLAVHFRLT